MNSNPLVSGASAAPAQAATLAQVLPLPSARAKSNEELLQAMRDRDKLVAELQQILLSQRSALARRQLQLVEIERQYQAQQEQQRLLSLQLQASRRELETLELELEVERQRNLDLSAQLAAYRRAFAQSNLTPPAAAR